MHTRVLGFAPQAQDSRSRESRLIRDGVIQPSACCPCDRDDHYMGVRGRHRVFRTVPSFSIHSLSSLLPILVPSEDPHERSSSTRSARPGHRCRSGRLRVPPGLAQRITGCRSQLMLPFRIRTKPASQSCGRARGRTCLKLNCLCVRAVTQDGCGPFSCQASGVHHV